MKNEFYYKFHFTLYWNEELARTYQSPTEPCFTTVSKATDEYTFNYSVMLSAYALSFMLHDEGRDAFTVRESAIIFGWLLSGRKRDDNPAFAWDALKYKFCAAVSTCSELQLIPQYADLRPTSDGFRDLTYAPRVDSDGKPALHFSFQADPVSRIVAMCDYLEQANRVDMKFRASSDCTWLGKCFD